MANKNYFSLENKSYYGSESAAELDRELGSRIKRARKAQSITQKELGSQLGISFQQIQKYENGKNRIGAGRLSQIAHILRTPTYELLGELPPDRPPPEEQPPHALRETEPEMVYKSLQSKYLSEAIDLLAAFDSIPNPKVREQIIELAQSFCDHYKKR